jgi:hypothetical protein
MRTLIAPLGLALGLLSALAISPGLAQQTKPQPRLEGGDEIVEHARAEDMALPRERFRAIQFEKASEFFAKHPDRSKTPSGLYLLDTQLIPRQLPEILDRNKVALGPNGSLVNQRGGKIVMLLRYKLVAVRKKQGLLPWFNDWALVGPTPARAASPTPLHWVTAWYSWTDDEGFCRSATAMTQATAWGSIDDKWGDRSLTNIQHIETVAEAGDAGADRQCAQCAWLMAIAVRNFGCGWPAHAAGEWGSATMKDGSFNWSFQW